MRIISGKYRGRHIQAPKSLNLRPTTDLAKESLFNILNNRIYFEEVKVLDLFAGTGNISYEFVSRGCVDVTCVEQNYRSIKFIKEIKNLLQLDALKIVQSDVLLFLKHASKYDIIFADPPYDFGKYPELVELIIEKNILNEEGLLIIEHPRDIVLSAFPGFMETRRYGKVHFSFFTPSES